MIERHEIEDKKREEQDTEQTLRWEAFYPDAIEQIRECFKNNGDIVYLINYLDLHFDDYDSLSNEDINFLVCSAVVANYMEI